MEELKLILATVSDLGGGAKWLFIAYLAKELAIYVIGFSCLGGGIIGTYKTIRRLVPAIEFEKSIGRISGCGSWMDQTDRYRILDILRKHYKL